MKLLHGKQGNRNARVTESRKSNFKKSQHLAESDSTPDEFDPDDSDFDDDSDDDDSSESWKAILKNNFLIVINDFISQH